MEIKGNIGEEIAVKCLIEGISVDRSGVVYEIHIDATKWTDETEVMGIRVRVPEDRLVFEGVKKSQKVVVVNQVEEQATTPVDEPPVVKRRPGRPKKATPEETMRKYEEIINSVDAGRRNK